MIKIITGFVLFGLIKVPANRCVRDNNTPSLIHHLDLNQSDESRSRIANSVNESFFLDRSSMVIFPQFSWNNLVLTVMQQFKVLRKMVLIAKHQFNGAF